MLWQPITVKIAKGRLCMLFKIQHGLVDVNPDFVQPSHSHTRGSQQLCHLEASKDVFHKSNVFLLDLKTQQLELAAYVSYPQPDSSGIQGSPCPPASNTPTSRSTTAVHSFNQGSGPFIGHGSFNIRQPTTLGAGKHLVASYISQPC